MERLTTEPPFKGESLAGVKFGRLRVIRLVGFVRRPARPNARYAVWECTCECGNIVHAVCSKLYGNTRSCGCLRSELAAEARLKHGGSKGKHPLYWTWQGMIQRCTNPKHHGWRWYGAKGVTVCDRWRDFNAFLSDLEGSWQPGLTLDRFPNNRGNYEPGNVRWATWKQQAENK